MTGAVLHVSRDQAEPRLLNPREMRDLLNRYNDLLDDPALYRKHQYTEGDLVVFDNFSVAHKADGSAHVKSHSDDGMLRIMHRTTVKGTRPFRAENVLTSVGFLDIEGENPYNKDGIWQ